MKLHASKRLLADGQVIAPSESFKKKNEQELERQQHKRENEEDKESTSPTSDMSKTEVRDNPTKANAFDTRDVRDRKHRLTSPKAKAATSLVDENEYAIPATEVQFAEIKAASRLLAGIVGPEDDPLTHCMENSGDEESCEINSDSTVDDYMPGMVDGFDVIGQEGENQNYAKRLASFVTANPPSTSNDNPFTYEEVETTKEDQPDSISRNFAAKDTDLVEEVLSDADPKLFNTVNSLPLGSQA